MKFARAKATNRVCAVIKELAETSGFLITAYLTDAIKEGDRIWTR